MVIVMEMNSGKPADNPCAYSEEALNASWLPPQCAPQPALQLQLQVAESAPRRTMPPPADIEAFLAAMSRNQK